MHTLRFTGRSVLRRGFTLIEALIATALVLLLGVAVVQVFTVTSDTVAAGTALSEITRNHKAVREVLARDFTGTDAPGNEEQLRASGIIDTAETPFISIVMSRVAVFPDAIAAELDDDAPDLTDGSVSDEAWDNIVRDDDFNGDGAVSGEEIIPRPILEARNSRVDTLMFFTRGEFRSQSGLESYVDPYDADQAFVHYGHLRMFNGDWANLNRTSAYGYPGRRFTQGGAGVNGNNRFASDLVLGRMAILLADPTDDVNGDGVLEGLAPGTAYINRNWAEPNDDSTTGMRPLSASGGSGRVVFSVDTNGDGVTDVESGLENIDGLDFSMDEARVDLASVNLEDFRERVDYVAGLGLTNPYWWDRRVAFGAFPLTSGSTTTNEAFRFMGNVLLPDFSASDELYFDPDSMAQRHHILMPGASQFIVEFAGDFATQNSDGEYISPLPDGVLDFYIANEDFNGSDASGEADDDTEEVRRIRWYGYPRDGNGDGIIARERPDENGDPSNDEISEDILPLFDWIPWQGTSGTGAQTAWPFERLHPIDNLDFSERPESDESYGYNGDDYSSGLYGDFERIDPDDNVRWDGVYQVSWSPQLFGTYSEPAFVANVGGQQVNIRLRPSLIRIVVGATDPQGRLEGTVFQEHVFRVRGPANFEPVN
ncbi:MAG: hypothetical protein AAGD32_07915 [Planctomycetota bacterium]